MLKMEIKDLKKYYGDRCILDIESIKIYENDKIGLVGQNGAGKTTLLKILKKEIFLDAGFIKKYDDIASIDQLECDMNQLELSDKKEQKNFQSPNKYSKYLSGGEKTRLKIVKAFGQKSGILIADEPSSNLDIKGVETLINKFKQYKGALIVVSHDRHLLDVVCTKIFELENGHIKSYDGNYSDYIVQKEKEKKTKLAEYKSYEKEKRKLQEAIHEVEYHSSTVKKTPTRMGNSEARLNKMGNQRAKKNLDQKAKAIKKRLELLEIKEKPVEIETIKLDLKAHESIHSKIILSCQNLNYSFEDKVLFKNAGFQVLKKSKVAIVGENGSGKTTLLKLIDQGFKEIKKSKVLKIGYFRQDLSILDNEKTILENMRESSDMSETMIRILLARLLFKSEEVYKKVSMLSGGERVKASFAKLILMDVNLLILDEPTNYLDLDSIRALELVLKEYKGSLIFVSHDRTFVENVATELLIIENKKIKSYNGNYKDYLDQEKNKNMKQNNEKELMKIEHKITTILSRICMPKLSDDVEALDLEYKELLKFKKEIKNIGK